MLHLAKRFGVDESGATAIEYGLIAAGIAVAIIHVVGACGGIFSKQEADDGDAQSDESEAEKSNREAHGQRCKKTPLSVCEGQEEEIPSGIRPIERGDDRRRSEGRHMTQWASARLGSTSGRRGNVVERRGETRRRQGFSHALHSRLDRDLFRNHAGAGSRPPMRQYCSGRGELPPPLPMSHHRRLSGFFTLIQSRDGPDR
jgi:pilus assembly protein Flp/PilA